MTGIAGPTRSDVKRGLREASSSEVRAKLRLVFAREAFDKIDALGPHWFIEDDGLDRVYCRPTMDVRSIGARHIGCIVGGVGKDFDELVIGILATLKAESGKAGNVIVVNAFRDTAAAHTYDGTTDRFAPYTPK